MIQKTYHITSFEAGGLENILREAAGLPAYQKSVQTLLVVLEQNWDVQKIRNKTELVKQILPKAEIVGITHYDGIQMDGTQPEHTTLNFLFFEEEAFSICRYQMKNSSDEELGRQLGRDMASRENCKGAMVLLSEYLRNVDVVLEEADRHMQGEIPVFGATGAFFSIQDQGEACSYVFDRDGCERDIMLAVIFHGKNLHIKASYNYGWTPVGRPMTITGMDGDFCVTEIDHQPAAAIYKKYLGLDPELVQVANICEFPLIIERNGLTVARIPVMCDSEGRIYFAAALRCGERVRFSYGAQQRIFSQIYQDCLEVRDFTPQGMFLVVCMNRLLFLKEQERHEVENYQKLVPDLAVLHGNSEIYQCAGAGAELNSALVAIGIREGEAAQPEVSLKKNMLEEDAASANYAIPLEYRVMAFMQAVTTDLEELTEKANAASRAKSLFLSNMSHEIRTPINSVLGMDEMILRETNEEQIAEYAENIRVAGNTLLSLVNDVLDFSKIEAGKMDIVNAEYGTASMLHDLVVMISGRAEAKGLVIKTEVAPELPSLLYGDEIRIRQVITNILTNAVKYTERGTVTLKVDGEKTDGDQVELSVSVRDTGIGIKEEDLEKLFTAFERIEEKRNRNIEGTGLGMSITTQLLSLMGSRLNVSSVYGEGSVFSFQLLQKVVSWEPIGDMEQAWKQAVKSREKYQVSFVAPDAHILAVDDTEMNLTVLKGLLKATRVQIDLVRSGQECLDKMTQNRYDLIFLDHRMPEMDGIETRERMDSLAGNLNEGVPVIAMTANAVPGAKEEYAGYGFADYLSKPIDAARLEEMVRDYLPAEKVAAPGDAVKAAGERAADGAMTGAATRAADGAEAEKMAGKTADDESEEAEAALAGVDGMDFSYAKMHLPTTELLKTAIRDFCTMAELHAGRLDEMYSRLPDGKAFADYRIQVHGMKSSAATIGVLPLAGMAKVLEDAAGNEELARIQHMHEIFVTLWRSYPDKFSVIFSGKDSRMPGVGQAQNADKPDYDPDMTRGLLAIIRTSMEEFDIDRADEMVERLKKYRYPQAMQELVDKLGALVSDMDDEGVGQCVEQIYQLLNGGV